jgi:hypothetical protein
MYQKLCLTAAFPVGVIVGIKPVLGLHQLPIHLIEMGGIGIKFAKIHYSVTIGKYPRQTRLLNIAKLYRQIQHFGLPAAVTFHPIFGDGVQHGGLTAEIKWHVIVEYAAYATRDLLAMTAGLDFLVGDIGVLTADGIICQQTTLQKDIRQIADVGNVE